MIELNGIGRTYERPGGEAVHALEDVSVRFERGEFVAVVGASGSGKSTLMNVLGLLDRPTEGRYLLDGQDVASLGIDDQARLRNQRIGFVFQAFHLLPRTSALENVELPLLYSDRKVTSGLGQRALTAVGLGDRMDHKPSELSGGQQQRVAIARALVNDPDLLLADEPTGNLDAGSAGEIMALFHALSAQGRTIILVTHDAALAARCGRITRLERGRVVEDDRRTTPLPSALADSRPTSAPRGEASNS
jgi:putative ABC transport system ATP-binding protein